MSAIVTNPGRKPTIVAHRGASGTAPENTLAAFRRALEMGVTALELDVHGTADGQIVVLHDAAVDRTTNGTGAVAALSFDEIRCLDAGAWKAPEFAGERVPTLAEVCALARGKAFLFVEVKAPSVVEEVLAILTRERMAGQAIVISFSPEAVAQTKQLRPDISAGLLSTRAGDLERVEALHADALCLQYGAVTPELVQALHAADRALMAWTVNEPEEMRWVADLGADFLTTDYPERALEALA